MFENRISSENAKAAVATFEPSANGKHPVHRLAEPSPNGSVAAAASGGRSSPSTNGEPTAPPQAAAATGRAASGQFAKGNRGGPGNPFARQTAALRKELLDTVTPEVMNRVVHKLIERSLEGDVPAIKLLLSYTIGKPAPAPEPDELDEHEWERFTKQATMFGQMTSVLAHPGPELPLTVVRSALPDITTANMNLLGNYLALPPKECKDFIDDLKSLPREQRLAKEAKLAKGLPAPNGKKKHGQAKRRG